MAGTGRRDRPLSRTRPARRPPGGAGGWRRASGGSPRCGPCATAHACTPSSKADWSASCSTQASSPLGRGRAHGEVDVQGQSPARAAAWVEGFMAGKGLLLVHDSRLLTLVDDWLTGLTPEEFTGVLPLLRRTFSRFEAPERRAIGQRVRASGGEEEGRRRQVDEGRAAPAVRTVEMILGVARG
ncbi:DUF5682 family protein [Nonomuraea recticatena]|uniref:DUF5682 family protein n=1 Tax=Nonomuraea recticatena TaxID=46178 RepID=UPI00361B96B7